MELRGTAAGNTPVRAWECGSKMEFPTVDLGARLGWRACLETWVGIIHGLAFTKPAWHARGPGFQPSVCLLLANTILWCCQCLVDPCIVSDTFRASRPGCPGPSRGKEPSLAFCSVPDSPFRLQIPPQRPSSYPWINCILPSLLCVSQGTELPSPVIPPCGFLKGLIICNAQIGFLLCPCNHWPACNLPSVKCRSRHAPSSIDTLVQEVKTQRNEPPCARPCRQTPCHPLPRSSHLVSLHSFVSPSLPPIVLLWNAVSLPSFSSQPLTHTTGPSAHDPVTSFLGERN